MARKLQRTFAAAEFKDRCLKLIDEVSRDGVPITVTKRGRPLVRVVPVQDAAGAESLEGTVLHEDPSIYSTGESFDADT